MGDDSAPCIGIGIGMQHVYAHAIPMTSESVPACLLVAPYIPQKWKETERIFLT